MQYKPDHAFILAAGLGTRLRPYTDHMPKPMVTIDGKPLLHYIIDELAASDVQKIIINTHYLPNCITESLQERKHPAIVFSYEENLLDTGGGIKKMLAELGENPFYIVNGDAFWINHENQGNPFDQLQQAWDEKTDILLLLQETNSMRLTQGQGDYNLDNLSTPVRAKNKDGAYMFTGIRMVRPAVFDNTPDHAFSFLSCMDKAQDKGTLKGLVYNGDWHHISTPQDLENVNAYFKSLRSKVDTIHG